VGHFVGQQSANPWEYGAFLIDFIGRNLIRPGKRDQSRSMTAS
jgi:hypothetical protein